MRHGPPLLLGLLCLTLPGLAVAQETPPASGGESASSDMAQELDRVVREALEQGLLAPIGEPPASQASVPAQSDAPHPATMPPPLNTDCPAAPILDFTMVAGLRQYQDIYALPIQGGPSPDPAEVELLAKAYLALGMNSEALMVMQRSDAPGLEPYRKLAVLMESREQPDVAYFREIAACDPSADFWLGIALIADGREEGVPLLREHMTAYRRLPLQLRSNVAAITASALSGLDEAPLARRLLAGFTEEEVQNSSRLRFTLALLNMSEGNFEGEDIVRSFMMEPQLQQEALSAILRSDREITGVEKDLMLEALLRQISRSESEGDIAASLGFTLRELSASARYDEIAALATLPALQGEQAQNAIRHHFIGTLRRGLTSADPLTNLVAIRALVSEPGLLNGRPEQAELYGNATRLAVRFGLYALAGELAHASNDAAEAARYEAIMAHRRGDHDTVYLLAEEHTSDHDIALLAAKSAIQSGDIPALRRYEAVLPEDAETLLTLIEEDAISGSWIVSDYVYDEAAGISDEAASGRVARVLAARRAVEQAGQPVTAVSITQIPEALSRSRQTISALTREVH